MNFNSVEFVAFLAVVILIYRIVPRRARTGVLLVASYVFYGTWDIRFLLILWTITLVTHYGGAAVHRAEAGRRRQVLVAGIALLDLGMLAVFKYLNFFLHSAERTMRSIGIEVTTPVLRLILPIGISFYVFESLSYVIDISRGRLAPNPELAMTALFLAYFPKSLAGPIERGAHLLPQLRSLDRPLSDTDVGSGLQLFLLGLVQKIVLADQAAPIASQIFGHPERFSAPALVAGTLAFSVQIYGDFAGYSNMARGVSRLLGIDLVRNFREPYLSRSVTEFWRRWHMSLSNWLRDYLYVPLGGNRGGPRRTYVNLGLTMLLGGLWHGASWNFVVWGGLHGAYLIVERLLGRTLDEQRPLRLRDVPAIFVTFGSVSFSWIFFRAGNFTVASRLIRGIVTFQGGEQPAKVVAVPLLLAAVVAIDVALRHLGSTRSMLQRPAAVQGIAYGSALVLVLVASGATAVPFIYFGF